MKIKNIIFLLLANLLLAIVFNLFLLPLDIITGQTSSIATITNYLYKLDPALVLLLVHLACVIIGFMYLGIKTTAKSILSAVSYPLLVKLTSPLVGLIPHNNDVITFVIFAAIIRGISNGLRYKSGFNFGGLAIIAEIIAKKYKFRKANVSIIINLIIIFIGGMFFGANSIMYSLILIYITVIVQNKVLLGISNNKSFYVVTTEIENTKNFIINELGHSATIFDVKGGFLEKKRKVILTIIPTRKYYRLKEGIKKIDKDAFFLITDSYQVKGAK